MGVNSNYDQDFFDTLHHGAKCSAEAIIPLLSELVAFDSVVDVGCGDGTWLAAFKEYGVQSCLGIDGDYVKQVQLRISPEEFRCWNLDTPLDLSQLGIHTPFDLVVSLEVAEHLPSAAAQSFIQSLTSLGPMVLFSAAIPSQGGTEHINEQWPEYWAKLFKAQNYVVIDCLREKIWNNDKVETWYAQNIFLFVDQDYLKYSPKLSEVAQSKHKIPLSLVHPKTYLSKLAYPQAYPHFIDQKTPEGAQLRINKNRFGYLDIEITQVNFSPSATITQKDNLQLDISYQAHKAIYEPVFCVYVVSQKDSKVYYKWDTQAHAISNKLVIGEGKISLLLEHLTLTEGDYFVDVGVFERHWSYLYDYHWHVYPLTVHSINHASNSDRLGIESDVRS